MNSTKPTGITANRQTSELLVTWKDGHESIYPFSLLRYACPCAECRESHEKLSNEPDSDVFPISLEDSPSTGLIKVEIVGTYAITIEWEDGHNFGIYNWKYLRALCPCQICRTNPHQH